MSTENKDDKTGSDGEPKLYAGKFKTVEELEAGYKNSLPTHQENETLKKQLDEVTKVPDTYLNPADVEVDPNRVTDIQLRAKEAGMTQAQYEKFLRGDKQRVQRAQESFETAKKEMGEEQLNLVTDFVNKAYPKELADGIIRSAVVNKEARQAILNQRANALNNRVPGMDKPGSNGGYTVTDADIQKAYAEKENRMLAPQNREKARQRYLNLIAAKSAQAGAN